MANETCVYEKPWVGTCGKDAVREDPPLCEEHAEKTCWCGEPAVRGCSVAGSLVCGRPLCEEHECNRKGSGMTGTMLHSKKGRQQYEEWKNDQ